MGNRLAVAGAIVTGVVIHVCPKSRLRYNEPVGCRTLAERTPFEPSHSE
jgi:hypothetical protein